MAKYKYTVISFRILLLVSIVFFSGVFALNKVEAATITGLAELYYQPGCSTPPNPYIVNEGTASIPQITNYKISSLYIHPDRMGHGGSITLTGGGKSATYTSADAADNTKCLNLADKGLTNGAATVRATSTIPMPKVTMTASPNPVPEDSQPMLSWSSSITAANSVCAGSAPCRCTLSSAGGFEGYKNLQGKEAVPQPITENTWYKMTCTNLRASVSNTVNIYLTLSCPVPEPDDAALCQGDDTGILTPTDSKIVEACSLPTGSAPKCEYTCEPGFFKNPNGDNECIPFTLSVKALAQPTCSFKPIGSTVKISYFMLPLVNYKDTETGINVTILPTGNIIYGVHCANTTAVSSFAITTPTNPYTTPQVCTATTTSTTHTFPSYAGASWKGVDATEEATTVLHSPFSGGWFGKFQVFLMSHGFIDSNGQITSGQAVWNYLQSHYDTNGDGFLSQSELGTFLSAIGCTYQERQAAYPFFLSGLGSVSDEFIAFFADLCNGVAGLN
jgi:hypothetical protein